MDQLKFVDIFLYSIAAAKKAPKKDKKEDSKKGKNPFANKKEDADKKEKNKNPFVNKWMKFKSKKSAQLIVTEGLIDNLFGKKIAQEKLDDNSCKLLSLYLATARGMFLLHQQNHWDSQNYGNHLLFQRLYEETQDIVDNTAERVVGLCGEIMFKGSEAGIARKFSAQEASMEALLQSSLNIEKAFQQVSKKTYDTLKEKNVLTLGLDDLIMAQASDSESHIYLLQQALKENASK